MENVKPSSQGIEFVGKHENILENGENREDMDNVKNKESTKPVSTPTNQEKRRRTLKEVIPLEQQESPAKKLNSRRSSARLVQSNQNEPQAPSLDRFHIQAHLPGIRKNVVASPKTVIIDQEPVQVSKVKNFWERKCKEEASNTKSNHFKKVESPTVEPIAEPIQEMEKEFIPKQETILEQDEKEQGHNLDKLYLLLMIGFLISGLGLFLMNHTQDMVSVWNMVYTHWKKDDVEYHWREAKEAFVNMSLFAKDFLYQQETLLNLTVVSIKGVKALMNESLEAFYSTSLWIQDLNLNDSFEKCWILFVTLLGRFQTLENSILSSFGFRMSDEEWIGNLLVTEMVFSLLLLLFCSWVLAKTLSRFL